MSWVDVWMCGSSVCIAEWVHQAGTFSILQWKWKVIQFLTNFIWFLILAFFWILRSVFAFEIGNKFYVPFWTVFAFEIGNEFYVPFSHSKLVITIGILHPARLLAGEFFKTIGFPTSNSNYPKVDGAAETRVLQPPELKSRWDPSSTAPSAAGYDKNERQLATHRR